MIIALLAVGGVYLSINQDTSNSTNKDNLESQTNQNNNDSNILIAYYSYTGNTEAMAKEIQNQVGGDLFQIERAKEYDDLYTEAKEEIDNNQRPELANNGENIEDYDVIFIGYPIWWDTTPAMINTFLESIDLTNKTIIPFCTSSSDSIDNSLNSIKVSAKNATILDGLRLSGSSSNNSEEIKNWLDDLGIFK